MCAQHCCMAAHVLTCARRRYELSHLLAHADVVVIGGANDGVPGCTQTVQDGGEFKLGSISIRCIDTPL